jgi:uncharacterized protein
MSKGFTNMPIAKASIPTVNGAKYMQQLCKHWSHKLEVDLSEQRGVVKFPAAVATFEPGADALQVTIEGEEGEAVERMKGVVASHLSTGSRSAKRRCGSIGHSAGR